MAPSCLFRNSFCSWREISINTNLVIDRGHSKESFKFKTGGRETRDGFESRQLVEIDHARLPVALPRGFPRQIGVPFVWNIDGEGHSSSHCSLAPSGQSFHIRGGLVDHSTHPKTTPLIEIQTCEVHQNASKNEKPQE